MKNRNKSKYIHFYYRKPKRNKFFLDQDVHLRSRESNINGKDDLRIDYSRKIKTELVKDNPNIELIEKLQDISLRDALIRFNETQLKIPVDGIKGFKVHNNGYLLIDYFTSYQTISSKLRDRLSEFGLDFMFPKTIESIDPITGLPQMKVTMRIYHTDGGLMTLQSKPVIISSRSIDGVELGIDECVTAAGTVCKRDLLCRTTFNILVNSPDCYCENARHLTINDMKLLNCQQKQKIENSICKHGNAHFWTYIHKKYNIKYIEMIRQHQYKTILLEAKRFRLSEIELKRIMTLNKRVNHKKRRQVTEIRCFK